MNTSHSLIDANWSPTAKILIAAIAIALIMQIFMVFRFEINQDEFYSLNIAYEAARGDFTNPFQTFFFRIARLLQYVPGYEVDQIVVGRIGIYFCAIITCLLIYKISRRYFSVEASLFALLSFFSFGFVFRHMTAFRYDMVITMLLMAVIWIVSDPQQNWKKVIAAGLLIGLSFTFALKSIFYAPIIAVFLIGRWVASQWSKQTFWYGFGTFISALVAYSLLYVLHDTSEFAVSKSANYLQDISSKSFFGGLFMRGDWFLHSFLSNIWAWGMVLIGACVIMSDLKDKSIRPRIETIGLLSFAASLSPIVFFFHANPYFYPFMLAPAVVFVAAAADRLLLKKRKMFFGVFAAILCLLTGTTFVKSMSQNQYDQRATINAVHEIFPESVPVIDYCGMISSFDRINESGLFINPDIFAMSKYVNAGRPIMVDIISKYKPKVMLSNIIEFPDSDQRIALFDNELVPEDTALLESHYLQFWGPIYIPGQRLQNNKAFEILVDGIYTYYGPDGVLINGLLFRNGQTVNLSEGQHLITRLSTNNAKIVWGDNLQKPNFTEPTGGLFNGF